jgi:DNA-binding response OmpR family regulator
MTERLAEQHKLASILQKEGWSVHVYTNAYDILSQSAFLPEPALFIIDLNVDRVSGLEICRWLKQKRDTSLIPVILLSSSPEMNVLAQDGPADRVLQLPFTTHRLLASVEETLTGHGDGLRKGQQESIVQA